MYDYTSAQWTPPGTPYPTTPCLICPLSSAPVLGFGFQPAGIPLFRLPYEPIVMTANPSGNWYDQQLQFANQAGGHLVVKKKRRHWTRRHHDDADDDSQDDQYLEAMSQNTPHRPMSLQRSASWGHSSAYGSDPGTGSLRQDKWDEDNLAHRPRDWRADFTGHDGIAGCLPSILRPKSDVHDWSDTEHRKVHSFLHYNPAYPPVQFDLRRQDLAEIVFPTLGRLPNLVDLAQLAFQPPAQLMRLVHPRLPWYIDIVGGCASGITVGEIFTALASQLAEPIYERHYYNDALSNEDRAVISLAFQRRCAGRWEHSCVQKVDYLGDHYIFQGLVRSARGMWEIKTTRP